jgi:hypothetical protein
MAKFYYKFWEGDYENDHQEMAKLYFESSWTNTSCPFSKIPILVNNKFTSIVNYYNFLKESVFRGEHDPANQRFLKRKPSTIRVCRGVNNILKNSIMLKAPCDIHISTQGEEIISTFANGKMMNFARIDHGREQYTQNNGENLFGDVIDVKFSFPISFETTSDMIFLQPQFHGNVPWTVVNGAINKNYAETLSLILLFPLTDEIKHYFIKAGTVMAYIWSPEKMTLKHNAKINPKHNNKFISN